MARRSYAVGHRPAVAPADDVMAVGAHQVDCTAGSWSGRHQREGCPDSEPPLCREQLIRRRVDHPHMAVEVDRGACRPRGREPARLDGRCPERDAGCGTRRPHGARGCHRRGDRGAAARRITGPLPTGAATSTARAGAWPGPDTAGAHRRADGCRRPLRGFGASSTSGRLAQAERREAPRCRRSCSRSAPSPPRTTTTRPPRTTCRRPCPHQANASP